MERGGTGGPRAGLAWAAALGGAFAVAGLIGGCGIFGGGGDKPEQPIGPETITLTLEGAELLNSCDEGVGNALAVRVYQLSGDARISMSALGSLWGSEDAELGKDLVDKSELILEPGAKVPVKVHPTAGAQFLAVVGNYCKSEGDCWRWVRPLDEVRSKTTLSFGESCIQAAGK